MHRSPTVVWSVDLWQIKPRVSREFDSFNMAFLKITDASGRQWQYSFLPQGVATIGRAPDNNVVL
ncbi:MAG: hypothetical protein M3Y84_13690, partial [Acidobacteriota bacterium]|nr:hypothetical protein [Acidobacteriota bacterium]